MLEKIPEKVPEDYFIKYSRECYQRFRGMLLKIPGNVQEDPGNVIKDFRECSRRFQEMFLKIMGNVQKDSGEYSRRF